MNYLHWHSVHAHGSEHGGYGYGYGIGYGYSGNAGITATNWGAKIAPKDGTVIISTYHVLLLEPLFGNAATEYHPPDLEWIGSMAKQQNICMTWHASKVKTIDDAKKAEVTVSATGTSGHTHIIPTMLNSLLGTKFKVIAGYQTAESRLAVERGEVDARVSSWTAVKTTRGDWLKEGKIVIWSSLDTDVQHAQLKAFSRKFPGITIEAFKLPPGPAVERAITEARAGKVNVDILDTNSGYLQLLFDRDLVKPYDWGGVFGLTKEQVLYGDRAIQIGHYDLPIAFNTTLARAEDFRSWEDLADPKWRGKILLEARGFGFAILAQEWGLERTTALVRRIVANNPIFNELATA